MLDSGALDQSYKTTGHSFGRRLTELGLDNNTVVKWLRTCGSSANVPLARIATRVWPDSIWCPEGFSEPAIHSRALTEALDSWTDRLRVRLLTRLTRNGIEQMIYTVASDATDASIKFSEISATNSWVGGVEKAMKAVQPLIDLTEDALPGSAEREAAKAAQRPEPPRPRRRAGARRKTRVRAGREIHVEGAESYKVPHNSPDILIAQVENSICIAAYKKSTGGRALVKLQMELRPVSDDELLARLDELFKPLTGYDWRFLIVAGAGRDNGRSSDVSAEDMYRYFSGNYGGRKRQAKGRARIHILDEQAKGRATLELSGHRIGREVTAIIRHLPDDAGQPVIIDMKSI